MKTKLNFLLFCLLLPFLLHAYDLEVDGLWYNLQSNGNGVTLVGSSNRSGNLKIPESITFRNRTFIVNSIKENAFVGCDFSEVSIPSGLKFIENRTFLDAKIKKLTIADGVERIGISAFEGSDIIELIIPNSVSRIDDFAFRACKNLSKITLGDGLQYISWGTFMNDDNIEEIICYSEIPPKLTVADMENYNKPVFTNMAYQFAVLKVPALSVGKYKASDSFNLWKNFAAIEPINAPQSSEFISLNCKWDEMGTIIKSFGRSGNSSTIDWPIIKPIFNGRDTKKTLLFKTTRNKIKDFACETFMISGYIQFDDMEAPSVFFSVPINPKGPLPYTFDCVMDDDRHFLMSFSEAKGEKLNGPYAMFTWSVDVVIKHQTKDNNTIELKYRLDEMPGTCFYVNQE